MPSYLEWVAGGNTPRRHKPGRREQKKTQVAAVTKDLDLEAKKPDSPATVTAVESPKPGPAKIDLEKSEADKLEKSEKFVSCKCKRVHFDEEVLKKSAMKKVEKENQGKHGKHNGDEDDENPAYGDDECTCNCKRCRNFHSSLKEVYSGENRPVNRNQQNRGQQYSPQNQSNQSNRQNQNQNQNQNQSQSQNCIQNQKHNCHQKKSPFQPVNSNPNQNVQRNSQQARNQPQSHHQRQQVASTEDPHRGHRWGERYDQLLAEQIKAVEVHHHMYEMDRMLRKAQSEVIIREDVMEDPRVDPAPNAFFDSKTGMLRVYHGPRWGNAMGSLLPIDGRNIGSTNHDIATRNFMQYPAWPSTYGTSSFGPGLHQQWGSQFGPPYSQQYPPHFSQSWGPQGPYQFPPPHPNSNQAGGINSAPSPTGTNKGNNNNSNQNSNGSAKPNSPNPSQKDAAWTSNDQNNNDNNGNTSWRDSNDNKGNNGAQDSSWGNNNNNDSSQGEPAAAVPGSWPTTDIQAAGNDSSSNNQDSSWGNNDNNDTSWGNNDNSNNSNQDTSWGNNDTRNSHSNNDSGNSWQADTTQTAMSGGSWGDGNDAGPTTSGGGDNDNSWGSPKPATWGNQNVAASSQTNNSNSGW